MDDGDLTIRFHAQPVAEAARLLAEAITAKEGRIRFAVAGGSVAPVLGAARRSLAPGLWKHVRLTWADERRVPFSHPDSNRGAAYRGGHLDSADPPCLELPLYLDGEAAETACERVRAAFRQEFQNGLDFLLLGLGEDGHIASLFPGRASMDPIVFAVEDSPKPPAARITLALPILSQASSSLMLATGSAKLAALQRLQRRDPGIPASALRCLNVITDLEVFA